MCNGESWQGQFQVFSKEQRRRCCRAQAAACWSHSQQSVWGLSLSCHSEGTRVVAGGTSTSALGWYPGMEVEDSLGKWLDPWPTFSHWNWLWIDYRLATALPYLLCGWYDLWQCQLIYSSQEFQEANAVLISILSTRDLRPAEIKEEVKLDPLAGVYPSSFNHSVILLVGCFQLDKCCACVDTFGPISCPLREVWLLWAVILVVPGSCVS